MLQHYSDYNLFTSSPEEKLYIRKQIKTGLLQGRTIAIKDNIAVKGWQLSCASGILANYLSPYHATVVQRILDGDGTIIGKTNLDEFAMGSSNEHTIFGSVKNPVDSTKVPGGSSGGSATAVALGVCDMALGSDTGGSVRQPAAFCGVYGLKPTYGRVSRYGLVAFASSFDQIGILSNSTQDAALLLQVIAGHDPSDATSSDRQVPEYFKKLSEPEQHKVGIPWEQITDGADVEIIDRLKSLITFLKSSGFDVKNINLPHLRYSIATYYILTMAEASSNLARYDGVRYGLSDRKNVLENMYRDTRSAGFGEEVKRRIMLGTYILSSGYYDAYYKKAQKVRRLIRDDFVNVFKNVDVIILPTTPTPAFDLGENLNDPIKMYLSDIFTTPINLAGIPALSVPAGTHSSGLPIGLQLVGDFFNEETILRLSHYIECNYTK